MTTYTRQFDQDGLPPIIIKIYKGISNIVLLRQGDNRIKIRGDKISEFAVEINECKQWSTSQ